MGLNQQMAPNTGGAWFVTENSETLLKSGPACSYSLDIRISCQIAHHIVFVWLDEYVWLGTGMQEMNKFESHNPQFHNSV